jgi:hypothetical protein
MGGLLAARELGIETGGVAPQGWWTEEGPRPELLRGFGLIECDEPGYPARTRLNVIQSDATLIVGPYETGGSALTYAVAQENGKPGFNVPYSSATRLHVRETNLAGFCEWLYVHRIRVLNVAGSRESSNPGIQDFTRQFLVEALTDPEWDGITLGFL